MRSMQLPSFLAAAALSLALFAAAGLAAASETAPRSWTWEWPDTDFSKTVVSFSEIRSGGPPKDGIPSIDAPRFIAVAEEDGLDPREPVIGLGIGDDARAYPLRILTWHEIVNDVVGGVPVAVTYCPLCNAAIVFDRRVEGAVLEFGTTGKLRKSDLVMYDRQTESWWQQFLGMAIVGEMTGTELAMLPSRLESWARFRERHPKGRVLVPNDPDMRRYGSNPYVGYDSESYPFLYRGTLPEDIEPMAYVVAVGEEAWSLALLREKETIERDGLRLSWSGGKASALDTRKIAEGRDIGNVVVQRQDASGAWVDTPYDLTFAFVFHAFRPDGRLYHE